MTDRPDDTPDPEAAAGAAPPEGGRTVFMPAGEAVKAPVDAAAEPDAGAPLAEAGGDRTVFMPSMPPGGETAPETSPVAASAPPASPVWDEVMPPPAPYAAPPAAEPEAAKGRIAPGVVLNHIYEVRTFIARGGMGEVYEGINIQTEERVAIKVILSHLAMDPAVQAMFRKEARTLTRLSHPGLVQYRVLAQEPQLGVLYIVTDYIDGGQLSDYVGKTHPDADELERLMRRLAAGLAAAHELGAIHRDMSPDNVLLPGGSLDQAKIIDFGIAKDLDASSKTIVGDGFAGKLGFVAPEQFGDFDREIGPWTDVYSLALVLLAVTAGQPVDMGVTLVDAIDKRRKGPDLSSVPDRLRPVFEGMLQANPLDRFRSMKEVLDALDRTHAPGGGVAAAPVTAPPPAAAPAPVAPSVATSRSAGAPKWAIPAAAAAVVLVLVLGGVLLFGRHGGSAAPGSATVAATGGAAAGAGDAEKVRAAVEGALPGAQCTWLDIDDVSEGPSGVSLRLSGVAGSPVQAQAAVQRAAAATGAKIGLVDTANVFPVGAATCAPLDAFRQFRVPNSQQGRAIVSQQSNWELMDKNPPCVGPNAKVVVNIAAGLTQNFTVLGFDRKGGLQQIFADRAALEAFKAQQPDLVTDKGGGSYAMTSCYNETGLVGEALISGAGPFDLGLPEAMKTDKSKVVDAAWLQAFRQKAQAGGWKTSMTWYRVVNDQPG